MVHTKANKLPMSARARYLYWNSRVTKILLWYVDNVSLKNIGQVKKLKDLMDRLRDYSMTEGKRSWHKPQVV